MISKRYSAILREFACISLQSYSDMTFFHVNVNIIKRSVSQLQNVNTSHELSTKFSFHVHYILNVYNVII